MVISNWAKLFSQYTPDKVIGFFNRQRFDGRWKLAEIFGGWKPLRPWRLLWFELIWYESSGPQTNKEYAYAKKWLRIGEYAQKKTTKNWRNKVGVITFVEQKHLPKVSISRLDFVLALISLSFLAYKIRMKYLPCLSLHTNFFTILLWLWSGNLLSIPFSIISPW